jgi:hypothetical protein
MEAVVIVLSGVLVLMFQSASPQPSCGTGNEAWPTKKCRRRA